ncbi:MULTISPECIES: Na+/H+ antiporter NhaC family protein [unclassified Shewanella]|uniref:Na+/H+ antiporter family protein n=1 Tax=unclassified Shewanella TaxID=196818 RepID=UPI000C850544|nr:MULTISPECIES: Na+/H+ antiporter NhaC family protein [unclassified Shewanella]MDO6621030.1 Na+/H+ antiporter NhaC family protein [Shewanella sp. 6_MG-2023]MDO6641731.1 Na+/H+ antiporter NhaC family protein [Shewanella sp. 5_MG-2023]MDO6680561.1 Na+/H+ antiporter NhaC family protein [Shewanella sp. 4_MG-2023]MDO6776928.1 Na+/H+ antiporter NhaC family protein [Shewanella sp. 3_MG-2023]PMG29929.1 sodium:proton antiporter [Shewanella sp. 10N.286.52.C2]
MNAVVIAVTLMLALSLMRVNVVIALTISALAAGLFGGLDIHQTITAFNNGLGGGAQIALSYALLGAFAAALSHSGLTTLISHNIIKKVGKEPNSTNTLVVRWLILASILIMAISSQNILPIHIAFIPILIPPLLHVLSKLNIDRRLVACIITFGLVTTYMILPIGFGGIFLNDILLANLNNNGLGAVKEQIPMAMMLPALGMITGLLIAVFITYRKPRQYEIKDVESTEKTVSINKKTIVISLFAIFATLVVQLQTDSMIFGALTGFLIFRFSGIIKADVRQDMFNQGVLMMANIGFIMIAAAGFAAVVKSTGEVSTLVTSLGDIIGDNKALAALLMLVVGLLITMGIGSSFSTIPIIATIYVPLAMTFGFSVAATIALVGTAAALGDAGSPASDSTLGPTAGLNADGQHDHIRDSVIPTFIHYNIPLIAFGWIAAMVL